MAGLRGKAKKESEVKDVAVEETVTPAKEEVVEIAPLEVKPVEVKVVEETKPTQPNVRVKLKNDLRTYIANQWYTFKAGQTYTVPKQVKDILAKAGQLEAL